MLNPPFLTSIVAVDWRTGCTNLHQYWCSFAQRFGRNTAKRLLREWGQSERFSGSRLLDKIGTNFMDYLPEAHHLFEMARMLDDEASRNWSCICHY